MQFLSNGKVMFDDVFEMNYHLFMELGIGINSQGYLFDQDTDKEIKYRDKYIKAAVTPQNIYAGRNDIVFDPSKNYNLIVSILGFYIDKREQSDDEKILYISQFLEDNPERTKQRVTIQSKVYGETTSQFYYNPYLAYIECIFLLSGNFIPDLSNFDVMITVAQALKEKEANRK